MKVVLHIGTEKTGTTSIQAFLGKNRDRLIQHGVAPLGEFLLPGTFNNLALPLAAKEAPGKDITAFRPEEFDSFRTRAQKSLLDFVDNSKQKNLTTLVASSEHMSSRLTTVDDIRALKNLFPGDCDYQIVVYLRQQRDLLLGMQAESIKAGNPSISFSDPRSLPKSQAYGIVFYDYEMMLANWAEVFGAGRITVRPYEREQLAGGDAVADFLTVIGLSADLYSATGQSLRLNERFSPEALFFLAKINSYIDADTRRRVVEKISAADQFGKGEFKPSGTQEDFISNLTESNSRVAQSYLGRELLFNNAHEALRMFDPSDFSRVEEVLTYFMKSLSSK